MKRSFLSLFILAASFSAYSQVGIGTNNPNTNAALEVTAVNNKGLLMPRGDAATRTALDANTAKGLMLYDTVTNSLWIHDGNGLPSGWHNQQPIVSRTLIPYSFGNISLTTAPDGSPATQMVPGFPAASLWQYPGPPTTSAAGLTAFIMPRSGTITSLSLYYNFNNPASYLVPPVVTAQVYTANAGPGGTNLFSPVPGAQTSIFFPNTVFTGTYGSSIINLSVPVSALERIIIGVYIAGPANATIFGNINAAIAIE